MDALEFIKNNESELKGDVAPFIADVELRAGFASAALGLHSRAVRHFQRARTDQILADERLKKLAMKAWIGEAESLLFGGSPLKSQATWKQIAAIPLANKEQRDGAQHNIRWIDDHVLAVTDWFDSKAGMDLRKSVASEPEGLQKTIAAQIEPLAKWFQAFPSKNGRGHDYSGLVDIWGRGGFSRIAAAVRADPLNAICVDASTIDEIALMARVFCPLYDTVIISWKGKIEPTFALIPMPDNLGPVGEFGGQGYMRTSTPISGKDGWHAAMGWANYLPKEVSKFLATDALSLIRSGRLVLFPAPLVGCTQSDVGWTDNLFVDWFLGGVLKTARETADISSDTLDRTKSRLSNLGALNIPFIDGVSLGDLNRILNDSGDDLRLLRQSIRGSIGSKGLRLEHWDGLYSYITDVREAFRQLDDRWQNLKTKYDSQGSWGISSLESTFSAMRRSDKWIGSDPVTNQLRAISGFQGDPGPWIPFWHMRKVGGEINWTGNLDLKSFPPDEAACAVGFDNSISQGWLYPGDGGPGMGAAFSISI